MNRLVAVAGALAAVVVLAVVAPRLAMPGAAFAALPALLVLLAAAGWGALVLRALGAFSRLDRERWVWSAIAGLGVVGTAQMLLAHAGLFRAAAASAVVVAGLAALALHRRDLARDLARPVDQPGALWLAALLPVAALVVARALAPPTFYDALVYHLGLPMQMAARGAAVVDVHDSYTALPLLAEMAASPALLVAGPEGQGFVYALEWLLLAAAVFVLARHTLAPSAGGAAAFVVASMPMVAFLPSATKPDLLAALFAAGVLRSLARLADGAVDDTHGPLLRLGALCTGFGIAAKTTFLAWAALIALVVVVLELRHKRLGARNAIAALGLVAAAGALPYLRNALALGAPLYPFAGGPEWAGRMRTVMAKDGHPARGLVDVLALPWRLAVENDPTSDEVLGAVWWVGLLALALVRPKPARPLLVFGALATLTLPAWLLTSAEPRYDPFLWLFLGLAAGAGLASVRGLAAIPFLVAALFAGAVNLQWSLAGDDALLRDPAGVLVQREPRETLLARAEPLFPAYAWLNEHAPRGCVLLATGDPRIAYLEVPAILSEVYAEPAPFPLVERARSVDEIVAALKDAGVTHVVVGKSAQNLWRRRGWVLDDAARGRFEGLASALGAPVYADDAALIFAVPGAAAIPPGRCALPASLR